MPYNALDFGSKRCRRNEVRDAVLSRSPPQFSNKKQLAPENLGNLPIKRAMKFSGATALVESDVIQWLQVVPDQGEHFPFRGTFAY